MPDDVVGRYINRLHAADPVFQFEWSRLSPLLRWFYICLLQRAESICDGTAARGVSVEELHDELSEFAKPYVCHIPNTCFPAPPEPSEWIRVSRDRNRLAQTFGEWWCRLGDLLDGYRGAALRFYGGIKPEDSVECKILEYQTKGAALDLWDTVRFRVVVPDLAGLVSLGSYFHTNVEHLVVRSRNYYVQPRAEPCGTYRALHFELTSDYRSFVEVQLMTAGRDAACLIDHSVVLKGSLNHAGTHHRTWLRRISCGVNLIESCQFIATAWRAQKICYAGRVKSAAPATMSTLTEGEGIDVKLALSA